VKVELESFCQSASSLEAFYKEILEKATPPQATPPNLKSPYMLALDSSIPTLGLPPGLFSRDGQGVNNNNQPLARDTSPGPFKLNNMVGVGSPMPHTGRRQSVQLGALPLSYGDISRTESNSPRGSIADGDGKT
jgi:hypothetical protein